MVEFLRKICLSAMFRRTSASLWRGYGPGLLQGREEDASCMEYGDRPSSQQFCIVS